MTIYELAEHLKLSVSTTSKAINGYPDVSDKTRRRVLKAAQSLGYEPSSAARSITTKKSFLIGVVSKEANGEGLMHPHFSEILEFFKKDIERGGYQMMFTGQNTGGTRRTLMQICRYRSLDGLLIMAEDCTNPEVIEVLQSDIPVVLVDFEWPGRPSVLSDNAAGIKLVVDYLVGLGHRRFMYLAGPQTENAFAVRREAIIKALGVHGLDIPEDMIRPSAGNDFHSGYQAMEAMLPYVGQATVAVGAYDGLMVGARCCLRDHGIRVPEAFSLTGFDNIKSEQVDYWQLTTVEQPRAQIGALAAKILLHNMARRACKGESILLPVKLVERGSCGPV